MDRKFLLVLCVFILGETNADEICYDALGCFSDGWPFVSVQRPIPYLPWSPGNISTAFWLYTRRNKYFSQELNYNDEESITQSNFKAIKDTKFIVHGFISEGSTRWVKELKNALLDAEDVNIIVVNWEKGANPKFDYGQACANTRLVGAQLALLMEKLETYTGALPRNFHIMGHSLGAHIAGYAGERLSRLGRITGLDPAGPFFEGTEPAVRLDPSDALFVDAIHTDGDPILNLGWGTLQQMGHADFYPNGGRDQPGCPGNEETDGPWWKVTCSHGRACDLMIDSISNQNKPMIGHSCVDYDAYLAGECDTCSGVGCAVLGMFSNVEEQATVSVKYYLKTKSDAPFSEEESV